MRFHRIKMRYSIEWILSFTKNMGQSLSDKYGQKLLDSGKKSTMDAIKTVSKRAIKKTAEATGDLIGNKIADKITNTSKKSLARSQNNDANNETEVAKKRYISSEERQQIKQYNNGTSKNSKFVRQRSIKSTV